MTQQDFINQIEQFDKQGLELIKQKNSDYATETDPFKNFRSADILGISPEQAILVRMLDKISRVAVLLNKSNAVLDEKIEDTVLDLKNYASILGVLLKNL